MKKPIINEKLFNRAYKKFYELNPNLKEIDFYYSDVIWDKKDKCFKTKLGDRELEANEFVRIGMDCITKEAALNCMTISGLLATLDNFYRGK